VVGDDEVRAYSSLCTLVWQRRYLINEGGRGHGERDFVVRKKIESGNKGDGGVGD